MEGLTLTWVHCWEKYLLILHSSTVSAVKTTIQKVANAILLSGLTSWSPFLARLYKQIEIHTSEGSGQQVLLLQLRRMADSSLSLQAIPARTPLQWGGNWTDHILFTHYAAKMKWVPPKHTLTGGWRKEELPPSMRHLLICANLGLRMHCEDFGKFVSLSLWVYLSVKEKEKEMGVYVWKNIWGDSFNVSVCVGACMCVCVCACLCPTSWVCLNYDKEYCIFSWVENISDSAYIWATAKENKKKREMRVWDWKLCTSV